MTAPGGDAESSVHSAQQIRASADMHPEVQPDDGRSPRLPAGGSLSGALEAILILADEPWSALRLAQALDISVTQSEHELEALAARYESRRSGIRLRLGNRGWQFFAAPLYHQLARSVIVDEQPSRLTQAALETLAVVAYRQPVSRSRIAAIRGVAVDSVVRTLVQRGLIEETGSDGTTGAALYCTTPMFLERLGVTDLSALPDLAGYLPDAYSLEDVDEHRST